MSEQPNLLDILNTVSEDEECLTEILYPLTETETQELIQRRIHVRETMSTQSNRGGTIYVPVVFHNVHQMDGATPLNSYCDYLMHHCLRSSRCLC